MPYGRGEDAAISTSRADTGGASSHVTQLLGKLAKDGLVYKNRHGRYSFAVPLLGEFIKRQLAEWPG